MNDQLKKLGFDESLLKEVRNSIPDECVPTRVTQVQKESYFVTEGKGEVYAEVTGRLMFGAESPLDLPVTGDWALSQIIDDSLAVIHEILPRRTMLRRKTPGKKTEFQAIASNIDYAMIIQALDADFSPRRLERYLIMARDGGIEPVVLLSKSDLVSGDEINARRSELQEISGGSKIISFSNENGDSIHEIISLLQTGKTYCLLGSSGVGKSTLLNNLVGKQLMETKEIREKDGKGRHTTTARQLIILESGAMIIDTPGMRELGNIAVAAGITETFGEIADLEGTCRFSDCTHQHEDACAILRAVSEGQISEERYGSYMKMRRESEYNEASYLELKNKQKKLGKLYKSVQKHNRKKIDN